MLQLALGTMRDLPRLQEITPAKVYPGRLVGKLCSVACRVNKMAFLAKRDKNSRATMKNAAILVTGGE